MTDFSRKVIGIIKDIPPGQTLSYGEVADLAGSPRGARQVARILHFCSKKYGLPWHRVTGKGGRISLPPGGGREEQIELLRQEGLEI